MTTSTPTFGGAEIVVAAQQFTDVWAGYAASDNAGHMTQTEAEAMAWLFTCCGEQPAAQDLLECWIEAEIEDGEIGRGEITVAETINGPVLVDHREET